MAKNKKKKNNNISIYLFIFLLFISSFGNSKIIKKLEKFSLFIPKLEETSKTENLEIEKELQEQYEVCVKKEFKEDELTEELKIEKKKVDNLILTNKYKASVYYEDIQTGFSYTYKPQTIYYGASLIKLVDALYLINKAIDGEINLDEETITYTEEYKKAFSSGLAKHKYGDKITLRELITHAIKVSDNSAHIMLFDYIGRENLKAYGKSLGAKYILTGSDKFGNQSVEDTNLYLKEAYRIITENEEYGSFLKEIMDNDVRNAFNTNTIKIHHKYGAYDIYFHDIGLSFEKYPYTISIFTLHEDQNYQEVIQTIHEEIRKLRDAFYERRQSTCFLEVYAIKK